MYRNYYRNYYNNYNNNCYSDYYSNHNYKESYYDEDYLDYSSDLVHYDPSLIEQAYYLGYKSASTGEEYYIDDEVLMYYYMMGKEANWWNATKAFAGGSLKAVGQGVAATGKQFASGVWGATKGVGQTLMGLGNTAKGGWDATVKAVDKGINAFAGGMRNAINEARRVRSGQVKIEGPTTIKLYDTPQQQAPVQQQAPKVQGQQQAPVQQQVKGGKKKNKNKNNSNANQQAQPSAQTGGEEVSSGVQEAQPKSWVDMANDAKQSVMNFFQSDTFKNNAGKWIAGAAAVPVATGIGGMGMGYLMAPSPRRHRDD